MLPQLWNRQIALDLINAVVIRGSFNYFNRLTVCEDDGFRDLERATHVGAIRSSSKFLDKPIIVLLFICKVVAFVVLNGLVLRNTVHF